MAYPKMLPCQKCKTADHLAVYTYEVGGGRHVECDQCFYLGPAASSITAAIRLHNESAAPSPSRSARPLQGEG